MLKLNYFLADIFILSAEKQPIKLSWRKIEWLLAYQRKGDAAILLSPLYMAIVYALIFSPIAMFIIELLKDPQSSNSIYVLAIYMLLVLLYAFRKYFLKTDIKLLSKKFARKKINRSIPDWCFFTILPLCFIWWIITYSMIVDFIIKPLGLRGAIYNWL